MKLLIAITICCLLSACIVQPKQKRVYPVNVKTAVVLDKEHKNKSVVIVNVRPAKSRKCWVHNRHWHCKL